MALEMDAGGGGSKGPFLTWTIKGTDDDVIPKLSWYVKEGAGETSSKKPVDLSGGAVFDFTNWKVGYKERTPLGTGGAPNWVWGTKPGKLPPKTPGEWSLGVHIPVLLRTGEVVLLEQAGAGIWNAIYALTRNITLPSPNHCPVVKHTGNEYLKFKTGDTRMPKLEVVKYVARPDAFNVEVAMDTDGDDWGSAPAPAAKPEPAMADLDDDVPF